MKRGMAFLWGAMLVVSCASPPAGPGSATRVLELEPLSQEIVWVYEGDPAESFFSMRRGSNQRLPNGNTLICESEKGHVFEVDAVGERVWEFWNPEIRDDRRKRIYRFMRVSEEEVRDLFRARNP